MKQVFPCFLVLLFFSPTSAQLRMVRGCRSLLFRVTGRQNKYVITCKCGEGLGSTVIARALTTDFTDLTVAQDRATIRCLRNRERRLTRACIRGPKEFIKRGNRALKTCQRAIPRKSDRKLPNPRNVNPRKCSSRSASFTSAETGEFATVIICTCKFRGFEVVPGQTDFVADASPFGPSREISNLRLCLQDTVKQLRKVCRSTPGDFELLSLQLLQVCCKRARRLFDKEKLQCAAAVPDDVSFLKDPSLI